MDETLLCSFLEHHKKSRGVGDVLIRALITWSFKNPTFARAH